MTRVDPQTANPPWPSAAVGVVALAAVLTACGADPTRHDGGERRQRHGADQPARDRGGSQFADDEDIGGSPSDPDGAQLWRGGLQAGHPADRLRLGGSGGHGHGRDLAVLGRHRGGRLGDHARVWSTGTRPPDPPP